MVFGSLLVGGRRKAREKCVRDLVAAVNRNDYGNIDSYLTSDIEFVDLGGAGIKGRRAFVEGDRLFRDATGNPQLMINTLDHNGEDVLVRGHLEGGSPDVNGATMWRLFFKGRRICRVEVTRTEGQRTMPALAARAANQPI